MVTVNVGWDMYNSEQEQINRKLFVLVIIKLSLAITNITI